MTPLTAEQRRDLMEIVDDRHDRAFPSEPARCPWSFGTSTSATPQSPTPCWTGSCTALTAST